MLGERYRLPLGVSLSIPSRPRFVPLGGLGYVSKVGEDSGTSESTDVRRPPTLVLSGSLDAATLVASSVVSPVDLLGASPVVPSIAPLKPNPGGVLLSPLPSG